MKNLLIDFDCVIPNLALMKLSTHLKTKGETVNLWQAREMKRHLPLDSPVLQEKYDKVWISTVFTWNKSKALWLQSFFESNGTSCELGGSGVDVEKKLTPEIEMLWPDYSLYPGDDRAVGFTQRGCIRGCEFCIVPRKEGKMKEHPYIPIKYWREERTKILLLDNEFADSQHHDEVLDYCKSEHLKLSISQGYDIRLVTREKAQRLSENKPWDTKFKRRALITAWDYFGIEGWVDRNLPILLDYFKPSEIEFYVICGFDNKEHTASFDGCGRYLFEERDLYRVKKLHYQYGVRPYVMPFNNRRDLAQLNLLRYWCNFRYINACNFEDFSYKKLRELRKERLTQKESSTN